MSEWLGAANLALGNAVLPPSFSNIAYVELTEVIEMRRQTTDYHDSSVDWGAVPKKIYTWDTPDKLTTNNYQAFTVGMNSIGFRFNVAQQTRAIVRFKTINDVIATVGGIKASIAGIAVIFYAIVCSKLVKK
jgi:hypothetical protein